MDVNANFSTSQTYQPEMVTVVKNDVLHALETMYDIALYYHHKEATEEIDLKQKNWCKYLANVISYADNQIKIIKNEKES